MFQFIVLLIFIVEINCVIINTKYGFINGFDYKTQNGKDAEIFLGIPFAQPPIGNLKFEKPASLRPWKGVLNATEMPTACAVHDPIYASKSSEDCLYLNIFKPKWKSPSKNGFPILVWIHGGSWIIGSCETYGYKAISDNFIPEGIIIVTIQYRLGPWGFMSTGDNRLPGNLGLWDQVEALKMINSIVRDINGDKNRITIMGQSAGSASVSWLSLSKHTDNLFTQAIELSGSVYASWTRSNEVVNFSLNLSEKLGCKKDMINLKHCLKTKTMNNIKNAMSNIGLFKQDINFAYVNPIVDGEFIRGINFDDSIKKAPKRPTLISVMSQDSLFWSYEQLGLMPPDEVYNLPDEEVQTYSRAKLVKFIRTKIATPQRFGIRANEAANDIINYYAETNVPRNPDNLFYFERFTQLLSDLHFNIPALREARLKSMAGFPTYFQVYSYEKPLEITEYPIHGSPHGAELNPIFRTLVYSGFEEVKNDEVISNTFVNMLSKFIKTGILMTRRFTVPKLTNTTFPYIDMKLPPKIKFNPFKNHYIFWEKMARKYRYDVSKGIHLNRFVTRTKQRKINNIPFKGI